MENHRPESTDEQLEHHSLPGTNMAGKGPADPERRVDNKDPRPDEKPDEKQEHEGDGGNGS